ncbi:hypothetical protein CFVI97532_07025 [Campylobacter fetus subsp. venerealis cfvi97/532]|nr:hypothetical protein CFVI97532_07025 [Campylobacter fetus subsp. venerealis cfvi97/532]
MNDKEYYQNMLDRQEDIQNLVCHTLGDTHIPIGNFECFDEHSMIMDGIEDIKDVKKISEIFSDMGYQTAIFSKEDKNVIVLADEEHNQSFNEATHYLFENNYKEYIEKRSRRI